MFLHPFVELREIAIVSGRICLAFFFDSGKDSLDEGARVCNRAVIVRLSHFRAALFNLFHDESMREMAGLQLHINHNLAPRFVDNIVAFAVRNDFIAVIGKKFVQIGHSVVDVCGFVLLALLVEHRSAHEIARIDRRQDDFPEGGRVVESAQAVFSERPS
jgi:hypothetical protein